MNRQTACLSAALVVLGLGVGIMGELSKNRIEERLENTTITSKSALWTSILNSQYEKMRASVSGSPIFSC